MKLRTTDGMVWGYEIPSNIKEISVLTIIVLHGLQEGGCVCLNTEDSPEWEMAMNELTGIADAVGLNLFEVGNHRFFLIDTSKVMKVS